ncbi:MAG TPA: CapA family protein, partial [Anaerolineales bacterium]|nr:CapA family protein [Anaerolineales bacterium]
ARLRAEGVVPIETFQHFEYYTYEAQPDQVADAEGMAAAGAAIVSGSQAHHPQAFAFSHDALIHHGLGNLFFDQLTVIPNGDIAFIDRHVIYNGRHISTELLTIRFVDFARARPMEPEERSLLLENAFRASGW